MSDLEKQARVCYLSISDDHIKKRINELLYEIEFSKTKTAKLEKELQEFLDIVCNDFDNQSF